jgi:polyisoprenoid-binding protein YceI
MADITALTPGTWTVDQSHSTVGFVARHLMISKTRGRFTSFSGRVSVPENPLDATVEATVDLASVDTGDEGRDGHLRSADFFDVEHFPTMTLSDTKVKAEGEYFTLHGDLTIKGVTRAVEFELEFEGVTNDPWGGTRAGFAAETEINRKDWGLTWNAALETGGVVVSDKVKILLEIELIKQS